MPVHLLPVRQFVGAPVWAGHRRVISAFQRQSHQRSQHLGKTIRLRSDEGELIEELIGHPRLVAPSCPRRRERSVSRNTTHFRWFLDSPKVAVSPSLLCGENHLIRPSGAFRPRHCRVHAETCVGAELHVHCISGSAFEMAALVGSRMARLNNGSPRHAWQPQTCTRSRCIFTTLREVFVL